VEVVEPEGLALHAEDVRDAGVRRPRGDLARRLSLEVDDRL
jgi:hypothetical protein